MIFREANIDDIHKYMEVRMAVHENVLNTPELVTFQDNVDYLTKFGKGWICEIENQIVGFSIVGLTQKHIWALFVLPNLEGKGIGSYLHDIMVNWYFERTQEKIYLTTEIKSKAVTFYKNRGWKEVGLYGTNEVKLELTYEIWGSKS